MKGANEGMQWTNKAKWKVNEGMRRVNEWKRSTNKRMLKWKEGIWWINEGKRGANEGMRKKTMEYNEQMKGCDQQMKEW
jgi:hypothetical protein